MMRSTRPPSGSKKPPARPLPSLPSPPSSLPTPPTRSCPAHTPPRFELKVAPGGLIKGLGSETDGNGNAIQGIWARFDALGDKDRNVALKGLLQRCAAGQVEFICTTLNLKFAEAELPPVHLGEVHGPLSRARRMMGGAVGVAGAKGMKDTPGNGMKDRLAVLDRKPYARAETPPTARPTTTKRASTPALPSSNMYSKLLNTNMDSDLVISQLPTMTLDMARQTASFLAERARKLQDTLAYLNRVAAQGNLDDAAATMLDAAVKVTSAQHSTVYILDHATGDLHAHASTWLESDTKVDRKHVLCSDRVLGGESSTVPDVRVDGDVLSHLTDFYTFDPISILTCPILGPGGRVLGMVECANKTTSPPFFSAEDESAVNSLCSIWTLILNRSGERREAAQHAEMLRDVMDGATSMAREDSVDAILAVASRHAKKLLGAERCAVMLVDPEAGDLWTSSGVGKGATVRVAMDRGIAGQVAASGVVRNILDMSKEQNFTPSVAKRLGATTRNMLCAPIRTATGEILGVVEAINKCPEPAVFTREDEMLVDAFGRLTAEVIQSSLLQIQSTSLAETASQQKEYLAQVLNAFPSIVMTLDESGRLRNVNHPEALGMEGMIDDMRTTECEVWLGRDNVEMVADVERVYRMAESGEDGGEVLKVAGKNFPFKCPGGEVKYVDYEVFPMRRVVDAEEVQDGNSKEDGDGGGDGEQGVQTEVILVIDVVDKHKRLLDALGRVMRSSDVSRILESPEELSRGMAQKASVMLTDIKNFSRISSAMDGWDTLALLNEHFATVVDSAVEQGGLVEKFLGDASLTVFGLPTPTPDDPVHAITAALRVRDSLAVSNASNVTRGWPEIKLVAAISTGTVLAGLVGTPSRSDFTVLGDAVTVALAIERAARDYGVCVCVCERTRDDVGGKFHVRELDTVEVRPGEETRMYEIVAEVEQEVTQERLTSMVCYELGLSEYRAKNYSTAVHQFTKSVQLTDDEPAKHMISKCSQKQREAADADAGL